MNPDLQQAYGFRKEFALDHDQGPWREKGLWATLEASFGARTLNARRLPSEKASKLEWTSAEGKVEARVYCCPGRGCPQAGVWGGETPQGERLGGQTCFHKCVRIWRVSPRKCSQPTRVCWTWKPCSDSLAGKSGRPEAPRIICILSPLVQDQIASAYRASSWGIPREKVGGAMSRVVVSTPSDASANEELVRGGVGLWESHQRPEGVGPSPFSEKQLPREGGTIVQLQVGHWSTRGLKL